MIKISVSRLEKEAIELDGEEPASFLEIEPTELLAVSAPIRYKLAARLVSGGVLVEGKVGTELTGTCGRCLVPVKQPVQTEKLTLFFELGDEEELDVTEDIRAEMLLALPMTLLCQQECRGLCPVCGVNRNLENCDCEEPDTGSGAWSALDGLKLE